MREREASDRGKSKACCFATRVNATECITGRKNQREGEGAGNGEVISSQQLVSPAMRERVMRRRG